MRNKNWIEFNNQDNQNEDLKNKIGLTKTKKIKIYKDKKGKKGKIITVISGFESEKKEQLVKLLKDLKVFCGTGGSQKDNIIQLQGDMQIKVMDYLRKEGYNISS